MSFDPDPKTPTPGKPRRRLASGLVISSLYLLVLVPVLVSEGPRERVRWYVAAAESRWRQGDPDTAHRLLNTALQLAPGDRELRMRRAEWQRQLGDEQASLADASQALEGTAGWERISLLIQRAELLQHLGRWNAAVQDWKEIIRLTESDSGPQAGRVVSVSRAQMLNGLAYARALAGIELDEALQDANEALEEQEGSSAILDTRGFIHLLMGNFSEALRDLNQAVNRATEELRIWRRIYDEQRHHLVDITELNRADQYYRRTLAVMLYHRALAYEQSTEPGKAARDYLRIRSELGMEPGPELF